MSSELRPEQRLRRSAAARSAGTGDETVLLHLARGEYYTLNPTGAHVWERLNVERTLGELHASIVERFDVAADRAWNDLVELVRDLAEENLVVLDELS